MAQAVLETGARRGALRLALLLCLLPATALAEATVEMRASALRLTMDDEVALTVRASGTYDELTAPTSDGFDFRQQGHQTQVSIVGQQMERIESFTFVGTPRRPGKYRVSGIEASADGRVVAQAQPLQIEVIGDQPSTGPAQPAAAASNLQRFAGRPYFVRPALSVESPFIGQPFVLTWELYWTRMMRLQGIREVGSPKYGTFDSEDLLRKGQPQQEMVQLGGQPYVRQMTHQALLSASREGKQRIESPSYRVEAGDVFETRAAHVGGEAIELDVRPVPMAGRPAEYRDANVGKLKLSGHLSRAGQPNAGALQAATGERLLLTYTVEGEGNLLGLTALRPPEVPGMSVEELPGRADEGVRRSIGGIEGKRTWQYVVSFANPGHTIVPVLRWAAFDPYDERFTTSEAGPFVVDVTGPAAAGGAVMPPAAVESSAPPATAATGSSAATPPAHASASSLLRPIAASAELAQQDQSLWYTSRVFWWLALSPWLGALALWASRLLEGRRARGQPARRRAAALGEAKAALERGAAQEPGAGYAAVRAAVATYIAGAFDVQITGLTEHALAEQLKIAGVDAAAVEQLAVELAHCDYARFAPGGDRAADLAQTAARVSALLERVDARALSAGSPRSAAGVAFVLAVLAAGAFAHPAGATTLDETFAKANRHYVAGEYKEAQEGYEALLRHDLRSAAVHFNLANALVKHKQLGRAVGHYKRALRLEPSAALRADILYNIGAVRNDLADQARRRHATLHVFDESPELDVALARAAPRTLLAILGLLGGFGVLALLFLRSRQKHGQHATGEVTFWSGMALCLALHLGSLGWLWHAQHVDAAVSEAVIIEEDASLSACQGVGETMGLPEGLEVRKLGELPDGRVAIRLPNGREGCVAATALYAEGP